MKFLVASTRHELLPLHHRLRREGHDSEVVVWRARYEKAWDGQVRKVLRHTDGSLSAEALAPAVEEATKGKLAVVTTVRRMAEVFEGSPLVYRDLPPVGSLRDRLCFGGWWEGGELVCPHLLVVDWGAWTGGLGPAVPGALTLIRLHDRPIPGLLGPVLTEVTGHIPAGWRGLVMFDAVEDHTTGEMRLGGLQAGWPWLHTQAFVAEMDNLGNTLAGTEMPFLTRRFVTVVPVTMPPWPNEKGAPVPEGVEVGGLTPLQQGRLMWFDIQVDRAARKLRTAGLDGLLAVAVGSSNSTPALARARSLELAARLEVPGKQFRADAGGAVDGVLATLEDRWGFEAV